MTPPSEQEEEEERLLLHNNNNKDITVQKCDNTKDEWRSTEEGQGTVWPGLNCFWTSQKAAQECRLGGNSWLLCLVSCCWIDRLFSLSHQSSSRLSNM